MTARKPNRDSDPTTLSVTAPARLHMGFLDLHGGLGRRFGSFGLALEQPFTRLHITRAPATTVRGPDAARALHYARAFMRQCGLPDGVDITIEQAIPAHAGLGSGTQLALATGLGIAHLFGLALNAGEIARRLDRGARSGIGVGAFEQGGFLIDGGRGTDDGPPPLICRLCFPENWRVLLIFDKRFEGVSGTMELRAFENLPEFPEAEAAHLCRLILMQALPALAESDIWTFGQAISEIQRRIGNHFAQIQGGRFTSPAVAQALDWLQGQGVAGVGQSSWGPTGFALCSDDSAARGLFKGLVQRCRHDPHLSFTLCQPRNSAGKISSLHQQ